MQPRSAKLLEVTAGKRLESYLADKVLRLAVERCFEIIGEAMRRLDEHDHATAAKISDAARIIAFRNVLIHGYSLVKHELVWSVVQFELPKLMGEVEGLLKRAS